MQPIETPKTVVPDALPGAPIQQLPQERAERLFQLGNRYHDIKNYPRALACFREILKIDNYPTAWVHAGNVLRDMGREGDALQVYLEAARLAPGHPDILDNIARALRNQGHLEEARHVIGEAYKLKPEDPDIVLTLAELTLQSGDFENGWRYFGQRELQIAPEIGELPPFWDGRKLGPDEKLLVFKEQGLGEEIMFASTFRQLLEYAPNVTVIGRPKLAPIFRRSFPEIEFADTFEVKDAKYVIPAGSLATMFRGSFDAFPRHSGYLMADPELVEDVASGYDPFRRIGLHWRSPRSKIDDWKSLKCVDYAPLFALKADFYSLQYGDTGYDEFMIGRDVFFDKSVDCSKEYERYFAQITAMDLVITNSAAAAHIAGALNVPCWVILPHARGLLWHWFLDREDSPWYPSLRLFRARKGERLADVVPRVRESLVSFLDGQTIQG